jgi:hypothetical protein
VGGPADVKEPGSARDQKYHQESISYLVRILQEAVLLQPEGELNICCDQCAFRPFFPEHPEMGLPEIQANSLAVIRFRAIPDDIKRQRSLLQDFYTTWKKEKFRSSKETEDEGTSVEGSIRKTPPQTEIGLKNCERITSSSDDLISAFSQLSNAFLLFANAYPKHAPTCYKMAESSFNMAILVSKVLSALWKLNHGFTLSSMETAIEKLETPITHILLAFNNASMCYHHLYTKFVKYVTSKKTFDPDEEFQIGYEQPPIEAQILAFTSAVDVSSVKLGEVIVQIRKLLERPTDLLKQEEVPGQGMKEEESKIQNTLHKVRIYIAAFAQNTRYLCHDITAVPILEP